MHVHRKGQMRISGPRHGRKYCDKTDLFYMANSFNHALFPDVFLRYTNKGSRSLFNFRIEILLQRHANRH